MALRYQTAKHIPQHFGVLPPLGRSTAAIIRVAKRDLEENVLPTLPQHPADCSRRHLSERNVVEWFYRHYDQIPRDRAVAADLATFLLDLYHRGDLWKSGVPRRTIQEVLWEVAKGDYSRKRLKAFEAALAVERATYV